MSTATRELVEKMGYTRVYDVRDGITRRIGEKQPFGQKLKRKQHRYDRHR